MTNLRAVALNERIPFHCQLCGRCCRHVKDSIMLEPMDACRLARHLRERGEPVSGTEDVLAQYAHASWLTERFPVFLLNTVGPMDACVFLKNGRCSVYEARPQGSVVYMGTIDEDVAKTHSGVTIDAAMKGAMPRITFM